MKPYRIPEIAQKYIEYDMIQAHTDLPELPEARLRLLYAFLNHDLSLTKQSELYTLVIALVQLGMDTHDLIDTDVEQRPEREMRSRQLKVLAGDYFSATFYQLLAKAGQVDMISKISNAVCEVNRLKVNLYLRMRQLKLTGDDYLNLAVQLRSTMFQLFSSLLKGTLSHLWLDMLNDVSRCEVILEEIKRCDSPVRFDKSWGYWHVMKEGTDEERQRLAVNATDLAYIKHLVDKYQIRSFLTAELKLSIEALKAKASKQESDKLIKDLSSIIDDLLNQMTSLTPALNETR